MNTVIGLVRGLVALVLVAAALCVLALGSLILALGWSEDEGAREWGLVYFWPITTLLFWPLIFVGLRLANLPNLRMPLYLAVPFLAAPWLLDFASAPALFVVALLLALNLAVWWHLSQAVSVWLGPSTITEGG